MLSKLTTDQIRKEAKEGFPNSACLRDGYETGAMAWAIWKEKAELAALEKSTFETKVLFLREALNEIANHYDPGTEANLIATAALEKFK